MDIIRGKNVKSTTIQTNISFKYKGNLEYLKESDARRLILKMLSMKLLKESFVSIKIKG